MFLNKLPIETVLSFLPFGDLLKMLSSTAINPLKKQLKNLPSLSSQFVVSNESIPSTIAIPADDENTVSVLAARFDSTENMRDRCVAMSVKLVAFLGNLAVCDNERQLIGALAQFGAGFVDHTTVRYLINSCIKPEPESLSSGLRSWLDTAKVSWQNARFAPVCAGVTNFVALAVSLNYVSERGLSLSVGQLEVVSNSWFKTTIAEKLTDPIALIMECMTFAVDIVEAVETNTLDHLFRPTSIVRTVAELRAYADDFRNGMLEDNHGIDPITYEMRLMSAKTELQHKVKSDSVRSVVWANMLTDVMKILTDVKTRNALSQPRRQPFCYLLYGGSGVGKSTLIPKINSYLLKGLDIPVGPTGTHDEMYAKINLAERYESTIFADKKVYEVDDAGQIDTSVDHGKSTAAFLIDNVNNSPSYAEKAELSGKGTVPKKPEIISLTSNLRDAGVTVDSNLPEAPSSRMHLKWEVRPRKKFCLENGRLDQVKVNNFPQEEHQEFRQYELHFPTKTSYAKRYIGEWIPMGKFVQKMILEARSHREKQEKAVEGIKEARKTEICKHCASPCQWCMCKQVTKVEKQFLQEVSLSEELTLSFAKYSSGITKFMYRHTSRFVMNVFSKMFMRLLLFNKFTLITTSVLSIAMTLVIPFLVNVHVLFLFLIVWVYMFSVICCYVYILHRLAVRQITTRLLSGDLPASLLTWFGCAVGMISTLMTLQRLSVVSQGVIISPTPQDIEERKKEQNKFYSYVPNNPSPPPPTETATVPQAHSNYAQNLARCTGSAKVDPEKVCANNAFFLKGQVAIVNTHFIETVGEDAIVRLNYGEVSKPTVNTHFEILEKFDDLTKVRFTSANFHTDITQWISVDKHSRSKMSTLLTRRKGGNLNLLPCRSTPIDQTMDAHPHIGWKSIPLEKPSIKGDCGGVLVAAEGPPYILGIHMAGTIIKEDDLGRVEGILQRNIPIVSCYAAMVPSKFVSSVELQMEVDGKIECDLVNLKRPHEHAVVHYGTKDEYGDAPMYATLGACPELRSRAKTSVGRTLMSPVLEEMGFPNKWGPPAFDVNRNHSTCFQFATHPMSSFPPVALAWAVKDYVAPMIAYMSKYVDYFSSRLWSPLDEFEMINGRGNTKYMRAMNLDTSAGYGLRGKKIEHVHEHVDEANGKKTHTAKDYVLDSIRELRCKLVSGCRCAPVFKSCLKDEPTKQLDSEGKPNKKVRLFFTMPFAFLAIGRSVLLPVVELISSNALMMECAVGLQDESAEWGQMYEYLTYFGNHIMEGDYSKYDMRISIQLINTVSNVFRRFAELLPYEHEHLVLLASWFVDVTNPIYAFAGAVVMFYGFNPSGNPVTVYVNSVVNSILHRLFYYDICMDHLGHIPGPFREFVHLLTYGDDSVAGVSPSIPFYNMVNFQIYLKRYKMPYTDARKSAKLPCYTSMEEVEFCKRNWVWIPHIEVWSAPLLEDSILKSLHCTIGNVEPREHSVMMIQDALRKFSFYPPDKFKVWRQRMVELARKLSLTPALQKALDRDYASWWKERQEEYGFSDSQLNRLRMEVMSPIFEDDLSEGELTF